MAFHGGLIARGKIKQATLSAVVLRADGRVEDLGTIAYYHRNPLRRWLHSLSRKPNAEGARN